VNEVMKDVLTEAMDLDGLKNLLRGMADGRIRCVAVDTPVPSQFSHEILNANPYAYLDDAPLEERRARAVEMRRILPESVLEEVGKLDPAAIAQVREEAWPDVRDADELHDVLHTLIAVPLMGQPPSAVQLSGPEQGFSPRTMTWRLSPTKLSSFARLDSRGGCPPWDVRMDGPVRRTPTAGPCSGWLEREPTLLVAAERAKMFSSLFPRASFDRAIVEIECVLPSQDDAPCARYRLDDASGSDHGRTTGIAARASSL